MRRNALTVLAVFAAAALLMGAKGCSDCEKYTAAAEAVCAQAGADSEACKQARTLAEEKCKPEEPKPTPTPEPPTPTPPASCKEVLCPPDKPLCAETPEGPTCYKPVTPPEPPGPPCAAEADLEVTVPQLAPQLQGIVQAEIQAMGDTTGQPPAVTLERLAARLRARGLCAFAGIEAVFVRRTDLNFEEYHAVYFGNGALIPSGKFMGTHYDKATAPPPVSSCPAPQPPRLWTAETLPSGWGEDMIGKARWSIKCKPHGRVIDCTPLVEPRACDYCASIGMGELSPGVPRCGCPVRPDGHPDRVACEMHLAEGSYRLQARNMAQCEGTDNPFQFLPSGGNCRLCNAAGTVCGDWY